MEKEEMEDHFTHQSKRYLSFLYAKTTLSIYDSLKITACCAVAAIKAIQKTIHYHHIKWVNDITINDFKVAGILCEATIDMNTAQIETMIVGIGINVHHNPMPADLQHMQDV
ncbi:MAG: hypothetical protein ACLRO0_05630 [Massilimicrobiota timonensis]